MSFYSLAMMKEEREETGDEAVVGISFSHSWERKVSLFNATKASPGFVLFLGFHAKRHHCVQRWYLLRAISM